MSAGAQRHNSQPGFEHCQTCADEAQQVRVVRLHDDGLATVDVNGREEVVSVALVGPEEGDSVLVHAGEAIAKIAE